MWINLSAIRKERRKTFQIQLSFNNKFFFHLWSYISCNSLSLSSFEKLWNFAHNIFTLLHTCYCPFSIEMREKVFFSNIQLKIYKFYYDAHFVMLSVSCLSCYCCWWWYCCVYCKAILWWEFNLVDSIVMFFCGCFYQLHLPSSSTIFSVQKPRKIKKYNNKKIKWKE
jgi:hypothetical protein